MASDPAQIGRYKILGTLGQGAMGTVYLAEDPALKRAVAIKTVRGGLGGDEVLARFHREAEISARLNHPNIITIFDVGEVQDLGPFLAMELVEGEGLDTLLKVGTLPPEEALQLLLQAGQALEAIHQAGIVHRDVKPSNFMVAKDGRLKLMDFGIARGNEPRLTTTAAFLGTPSYAAPESLMGSSKPAEAADRWALSVTAFEMLTGRLPFEAESVNALLYRVAHEPAKFPDGMTPELKAVFERALDKDPARRFESTRAFLRALVEALPLDSAERSAVVAQLEAPASATGLYRMPSRRRLRVPKAAWVAGIASVALLAAWAIWAWSGSTRVVAIYSSPSGARVWLDGTALGSTPMPEVVIRGRGGKLRLEKPEYLPLEHALGSDEQRLDLRLIPAPYRVKVTTEPAGAEIRLDGVLVGAAPQELEVSGEGRHSLEIRAEGYEPWSLVLNRREPLPGIIHLRKRGAVRPAPREGRVKRFFKNLTR